MPSGYVEHIQTLGEHSVYSGITIDIVIPEEAHGDQEEKTNEAWLVGKVLL